MTDKHAKLEAQLASGNVQQEADQVCLDVQLEGYISPPPEQELLDRIQELEEQLEASKKAVTFEQTQRESIKEKLQRELRLLTTSWCENDHTHPPETQCICVQVRSWDELPAAGGQAHGACALGVPPRAAPGCHRRQAVVVPPLLLSLCTRLT